PLAPIRTAVQVLRLTGEDPVVAAEALAILERQLGHLVRLVDDLLDLSRIASGRVELRRERIDLAAAVHSAVEASRPVVDEAGHTLTVTLPAEPVPLDADLTRLEQVFANLLNNAARYTERGGRITLAATREGDEAVVRVRDTGMGISARALPQVF